MKNVVTKGQEIRNGRAYGVVTKVVLADGYSVTFIGPMGKREAIAQALRHQARGGQP